MVPKCQRVPAPNEPGRPFRLSPVVAVPIAALVTLLIATSGRYGYHRDELYFVVAGRHPTFGYPDQPPLVPLLCAAMNAIAPGPLVVLRCRLRWPPPVPSLSRP